MRGCGAGFGLATKLTHAGRSEDVSAAVKFIGTYCPGSQLTVVGFSLGGNQVLKLLGEWGSETPAYVVRAMAVAPPIDLKACTRNIERTSRFVYNWSFVKSLVRDIRRRRGSLPVELSPPPRTVFEFDDRVTALRHQAEKEFGQRQSTEVAKRAAAAARRQLQIQPVGKRSAPKRSVSRRVVK
jgi:predicted alpha/beta-fold hydrolase